MYAHVTTYRHGEQEETDREIFACLESGEVISDQTARTIASWYHSSSMGSRHITALSHGRPFVTEDLEHEIKRDVDDPGLRTLLLAWLGVLVTQLEEDQW